MAQGQAQKFFAIFGKIFLNFKKMFSKNHFYKVDFQKFFFQKVLEKFSIFFLIFFQKWSILHIRFFEKDFFSKNFQKIFEKFFKNFFSNFFPKHGVLGLDFKK